jgi:hypothetical protein
MSERHHDHHDHDHHDHPPGGGSHFSDVELRVSVGNVSTLRRRSLGGPPAPDVICQTQTAAALGADGSRAVFGPGLREFFNDLAAVPVLSMLRFDAGMAGEPEPECAVA